MEPEKDLSEFIQKKDEDIEGIVDSVKSNFQLSKSDISDIIDEELIGSIETENKKEVDDYKNLEYSIFFANTPKISLSS